MLSRWGTKCDSTDVSLTLMNRACNSTESELGVTAFAAIIGGPNAIKTFEPYGSNTVDWSSTIARERFAFCDMPSHQEQP